MILHYVSAMLAKGPFAIQVASWHHDERPKYGADGQVILTCNHPVTRRRKVSRSKRLSSIVAASFHTIGTPLMYTVACNDHVRTPVNEA